MTKKEKNTHKTLCESLRFQTLWKAKNVYPSMTDEIVQRINMEIEWIERQKLVRGFLQLMTIMEAAYSQLDMSIGHENGFLSGSVVAYCLGLTDKDPIAENQISPEFSQKSKIRNLNVGIRFDPDKRNTVITLAEEKFGKSMMRTGVPILKLDNIILEFHRNL